MEKKRKSEIDKIKEGENNGEIRKRRNKEKKV